MAQARRRSRSAFTLIEIALSIAIVAFALVAIIGILPTGLEVQRENREDTIINQEGPKFIEALRAGSTNLFTLTNHVEWIDLFIDTNFIRRVYGTNLTPREIIGFFSTPKYVDDGTGTNTLRLSLRAKIRAESGPLAAEAANVRDLAFSYLLSSEIVPYQVSPFGADPNVTAAVQTNLWELRLLYRWPLISEQTNNVTTGTGRRTFRALVSARLAQEDQTNSMGVVTNTLWFFTPDTFMAN